MVKLAYDSKMKNPKGPCVVVIHANWCGHCKTLMPKFENDIVTSDEFSKELDGLLSLGSIEEADYDNDVTKEIFGNVDGYPTIRYIHFDQGGKSRESFDLPPNTPREPINIIEWINGEVKNHVVKVKNHVVKVKNHVVKVKNHVVSVKNHVVKVKNKQGKKLKKTMKGGKNKKNRTMRKKNKKNKSKSKNF